jgi:hypothetical protein
MGGSAVGVVWCYEKGSAEGGCRRLFCLRLTGGVLDVVMGVGGSIGGMAMKVLRRLARTNLDRESLTKNTKLSRRFQTAFLRESRVVWFEEGV